MPIACILIVLCYSWHVVLLMLVSGLLFFIEVIFKLLLCPELVVGGAIFVFLNQSHVDAYCRLINVSRQVFIVSHLI